MTLTIDYHKNLNALNTVDKTYQPQLLSACQDLQQSNKLY